MCRTVTRDFCFGCFCIILKVKKIVHFLKHWCLKWPQQDYLQRNLAYLGVMCSIFLKKWVNRTSGRQPKKPNAQQIASMIVWRSCPWSPARMTQDLRDGSDPSVDPSTAHWSLVRNGLGVSVAVRKPFLKTGNGLRDTKGTNPNVNFWIRSSSVRSGEKHSTVPHF